MRPGRKIAQSGLKSSHRACYPPETFEVQNGHFLRFQGEIRTKRTISSEEILEESC